MSSSSSAISNTKAIVIDQFCFRQFEEKDSSKSYGGTVFSNSIATFEKIVNERYEEDKLVDGYADFCKHVFIENDFTDAQVNILPITSENEHCLRTKYEARNDRELPVLTRFFPKELVVSSDNPLPKAKYLDLILYSREQIRKESEAMNQDIDDKETAPWGLISIKAQDADYEIPMTPITSMRNALGKEEGGSGVPIEKKSYMEAYKFWNEHATVS